MASSPSFSTMYSCSFSSPTCTRRPAIASAIAVSIASTLGIASTPDVSAPTIPRARPSSLATSGLSSDRVLNHALLSSATPAIRNSPGIA